MSQPLPARRNWHHIIRSPERTALPPTDIDALTELVCQRLFRWPLGDDHHSEPLHNAPHLNTFEHTIRTHMCAYVRSLAEEMLGLRPKGSDHTHQMEATFYQALKDCWPHLWLSPLRPATPHQLDLHSAAQYHLARALYPPYTLPPAVKSDMLDEACAHVMNLLQSETLPPAQQALMANNDHFLNLLDDALRGLANVHFAASQDRQPAQHDDIVHGQRARWSFRAERDQHHRHRTTLRLPPGHTAPHYPADPYDLFAYLEDKLGTTDAGALGKHICEGFLGALDQATQRFERVHHLDEPFYHRGKMPQIG